MGMTEVLVKDDFTLVHGSPRLPLWEYIAHAFTASDNFKCFDTRFCLVGHTHVPFVFEQDEILVNEGHMGSGDILKLGDRRLIINPGGVGQPRDRDPRASYAIYDTEEFAFYNYRVTYDIESTQAKMEKEGLPGFLVTRIAWGV
jgi:diadenosine tetraphosphatase ApaH/serine/threonine PP2A family protein phosphatase